jgi:hypothetical protein
MVVIALHSKLLVLMACFSLYFFVQTKQTQLLYKKVLGGLLNLTCIGVKNEMKFKIKKKKPNQ